MTGRPIVSINERLGSPLKLATVLPTIVIVDKNSTLKFCQLLLKQSL